MHFYDVNTIFTFCFVFLCIYLHFFFFLFRADLYHDEEIQQLLKYRPEWEELYDKILPDSYITSDNISKTISFRIIKS